MTCCLRFPRFSAVPPLRGSLGELSLSSTSLVPVSWKLGKTGAVCRSVVNPVTSLTGNPLPPVGFQGFACAAVAGSREDAASPRSEVVLLGWGAHGGPWHTLRFVRRAIPGVPNTPPVSVPEKGEGVVAPLATPALELSGAVSPSRGGKEVVRATC